MLRLLLVAALLAQGCGVRPQGLLVPRYSLNPESEAWRDPAPPPDIRPRTHAHCVSNADGVTTCRCLDRNMREIMCYDEV